MNHSKSPEIMTIAYNFQRTPLTKKYLYSLAEHGEYNQLTRAIENKENGRTVRYIDLIWHTFFVGFKKIRDKSQNGIVYELYCDS